MNMILRSAIAIAAMSLVTPAIASTVRPDVDLYNHPAIAVAAR